MRAIDPAMAEQLAATKLAAFYAEEDAGWRRTDNPAEVVPNAPQPVEVPAQRAPPLASQAASIEAPQLITEPFAAFEITLLQKSDGPLTKTIKLGDDGRLIGDGSACVMSSGLARRYPVTSLDGFAGLIAGLKTDQAIALGSLRPDLPDLVSVGTKHKLKSLPEFGRGELIARTGQYIEYAANRAALALIDVDTKDMPTAVRAQIMEAGGFWNALIVVVPKLATAGRVARNSTSSGISRVDTGRQIEGSDGLHIFILIADGNDAERFLRTLHDLCWLAGLGWL